MDKHPSTSFSAVEKIGSVDHILTEILIRLPLRSLVRFKSVSKHWYSLTSSPDFKLLQNPNPDPPSGIYISFNAKRIHAEHKYEFIPFDIENPVNAPFTNLRFDRHFDEDIQLEHSCNGLMLCSAFTNKTKAWMDNFLFMYYIYNPTVNEFKKLPRFEMYDDSIKLGMALAFDPSKSPHYKVIAVGGYRYESSSDYGESDSDDDALVKIDCVIHIYSSKTRKVKNSHSFLLEEGLGKNKNLFKDGVYWNNAVHWLKHPGFLFYFDLGQEIVHEMKTPLAPSSSEKTAFWNYIFESRDALLLTEIDDPKSLKLRIHELKRDYSSWSLKYHVDLEHVGAAFPKIMDPFNSNVSLLSVVLGEREDDSFLVLEVERKAVRFNLVSKTFRLLHKFARKDWRKSDIPEFNVLRRRQIYQFRESVHSF